MSINVKFGGVSIVKPGVYAGPLLGSPQDPRAIPLKDLFCLLYRLNMKSVLNFDGHDFDRYVDRLLGNQEVYEKRKFLESCIGLKNTPETQEYIRQNLRYIEEKYRRTYGSPFWY